MKKFIIKIMVVIMFLTVALIVFNIASDYSLGEIYNKNEIRVIIDNVEITKKLPDPAKIIDDSLMLSQDTVDIWFDKNLHYDKIYNTLISTTDTSVARLKVDENEIYIDGDKIDSAKGATTIDDIVYIPINELSKFYDIDVKYNEKIIITTKNKEYTAVRLENAIDLYKLKKNMSRKISSAKTGEIINVYGDFNDEIWLLARDERGNIGYVNKNDMVQNEIETILQTPKKEMPNVNLVWDYAEYMIPNRVGQEKIDIIDVIAPTCLYVKNSNGDIRNTLTSEYVSWAKGEGYDVWATLKNDNLPMSDLSKIINDMNLREKLIDNILNVLKRYNVDGVNIDFENMYKDDANMFSQFVRELSSSLRGNDMAVSINVTVPDGSDTWSLCYDRDALCEAVDYMVLMAYDMIGGTTKKEGASAPLYWVEQNIEKMIGREEIPNEKLILRNPILFKDL